MGQRFEKFWWGQHWYTEGFEESLQVYYLLSASIPFTFKLHPPKDFSQRVTAAQDILCVQIPFNCILSTIPWRTPFIDDKRVSQTFSRELWDLKALTESNDLCNFIFCGEHHCSVWTLKWWGSHSNSKNTLIGRMSTHVGLKDSTLVGWVLNIPVHQRDQNIPLLCPPNHFLLIPF